MVAVNIAWKLFSLPGNEIAMARKKDNTTTYLLLGGIAYLLFSGRGGFGVGRPLSVSVRMATGGLPYPNPDRQQKNITALEVTVRNNTSQQIALRGGRFAVDVSRLKIDPEFSSRLKEDIYYYWFGEQWGRPDVTLLPNETRTFYILGGPQHAGNVVAELAMLRAVEFPEQYVWTERNFRGVPVAGEFWLQDGRTYRFFDLLTQVVRPAQWTSYPEGVGGPERRTIIDAIFDLIDMFAEQGFPGQEGGPAPGDWERSGDVFSIPDILGAPGQPFPSPGP